eukprot:1707053-Pyramimonas_sp.AAC.1
MMYRSSLSSGSDARVSRGDGPWGAAHNALPIVKSTAMVRSSTPANDPRYDNRWKMPGYTGHICCVSETIAATPVVAQVKSASKYSRC